MIKVKYAYCVLNSFPVKMGTGSLLLNLKIYKMRDHKDVMRIVMGYKF